MGAMIGSPCSVAPAGVATARNSGASFRAASPNPRPAGVSEATTHLESRPAAVKTHCSTALPPTPFLSAFSGKARLNSDWLGSLTHLAPVGGMAAARPSSGLGLQGQGQQNGDEHDGLLQPQEA
jgi:hypothetical protein